MNPEKPAENTSAKERGGTVRLYWEGARARDICSRKMMGMVECVVTITLTISEYVRVLFSRSTRGLSFLVVK